MKILMIADEEQQKELQSTKIEYNAEVVFNNTLLNAVDYKNFNSIFILNESWRKFDFNIAEEKPVFINSVIEPLSQLKLPHYVSRMNAWPGFLQREVWEISSNENQSFENIFASLNRKSIPVKDEPGFVAARVMSMIINEAFYALGEGVSTREEINLAMKSGTNYPAGPFEWTEKIGIKNIYTLLEKLSEKENRYHPAPALKKLFLEKPGIDL
ncbi:MAG: 3-hydroxyacyl-CoA dehydrogenase family protein [Ginsengibacter sp.]